MDDIDIANELAATFNDAALKTALTKGAARPSTGICRACRQPIEPERLRIAPGTQLCHDCAEDAEAEEMRARKTGIAR